MWVSMFEGSGWGRLALTLALLSDCGPTRTPWTQLAATLPHLEHLQKLADALSSDPTCYRLLEEWLEMHQRTKPFQTAWNRDRAASPDPLYAHDPLFQLPAISNALGPLLPGLLKQLLLESRRLLIYVPHGVSTMQAGAIAFNLGELALAGCQAPTHAARGPRGAMAQDRHGIDVRGLIGLHDVSAMQEEEKRRAQEPALALAWIAWTSDRVLLDKPGLYDTLLDLSPMAPAQHRPIEEEEGFAAPTVLPRLMRSERRQVDGRTTVVMSKQSWTTREFAIYRGVDERASMQIDSARQNRHSLARRVSQSSLRHAAAAEPPTYKRTLARTQAKPTSSATPSTSTLVAFFRFWLSNLWILPRSWRLNLRAGYGYIPLSIRSDGGVRASIMLLPDSDSEEDSVEEEECVPTRQSSAPNSPQLRRRSLETADMMDDPILAAVGAGSTLSRRRTKSRTAASQTSTSHLVGEAASMQADPFHASPSMLPPRADRAGRAASDAWEHEMCEAKESIRLACMLFAGWSDWVHELVEDVQELLQERAAEAGILGEDEDFTEYGIPSSDASQGPRKRRHCRLATGGEQADDDALLATTDDGSTALRLSSHDLRQVGLSRNAVDVELVQRLARTITDLPVLVERGWSFFSWLGW